MGTRYRPAIPDRVKLIVVLRQEGKCGCGCGLKLGTLENTEFDHCPPLALREYDEATRTYTPAANDPDKIVARIKEQHRAKTHHPRGPHTTIGSDQHLIHKAEPAQVSKFVVQKPAPQPPAPASAPPDPPGRCRSCGGWPGECICPPRQERSSFRRRA
jgi:hypothetical protein